MSDRVDYNAVLDKVDDNAESDRVDDNAVLDKVDGNAVCLFVLRFYGPVNPMGSCRARSIYLTTRLLGRLSPLSS